uniref:T9SS sorting signal type C domain-containing protein n=1 Tax=Flavobacterium sp. TaxID=239 RepID=UPI0037BF558B
FGSSAITLTPSSGTVANTTLYARLIAGLGLGTGGSNTVRQVNVAATGTTTKTIQFTASVNGINTSGITGSALSYVTGSGPSAEGSFTVTTNGLTSDLVVTPGSDLDVSTTSGTGFQSTAITLPSTTTSQVIYSRLKTGLSAGSYSGASTAVVVSSTGFTSATKQFTGTITDPPTTWNGTSWSNTSGPTTSIDAIIDGNFSTTVSGVTAGFTAKTLTVNATRSFTINSGHNITVAGAITNNGTITVENNANLIQVNNVANTGSGTAIVKRNSASIQLYDYTLWSSPVAGQNLKAFSPNTLNNRFYSYDYSQNLYSEIDPLNTSFSPATGYLIRAPNTWTAATPNTFNGVFTGVPNNGNISLSASALASDKFYAVGNPYPSTISADLFLNGNTTGGTLYFWRKINNATTTPTTSYATYTLAGGVGTGTPNSGGSSSITPDGTIQVGQGFIVKTGASSPASLNFTNAMRTSSNTSPFLRTTENRSRFWLNLTSSTGAFCQTMVAYMPEATSGVDNAIDGRYFNDSPIALTSIINAEEYTIQGRALPFATLDTVPLGFKTDAAGNYTIAIDHVDGLFSSGQAIYLIDNLLNTVNNLSAGSYSFASAIGTFNSRFEVVYQSALAETNPTFTANSVIAFSENDEIRINSGSTIMELVRVYDLQGRLLVEKKQINSSETKLSTTATNQVLLLEITAANGLKVTKKIIQ